MDITFNIMIVSLLLGFYFLKNYCRKHYKKEYIFKISTIYLFVPLSKPTDFTRD